MIGDLQAAGGASPIEADVCIVGAGAAGISLARELAGSRLQVCLVESGGLEFEQNVQDLYEGESVGLPHNGMSIGRLRFFGGTTNHWGGRCTTLSEIDFAARDWVPHSGWPISRAALAPFYERARALCGLGPAEPLDAVLSRLRVTLPALRPGWLKAQHWQYAPGANGAWSFGSVYREDLRRAANVRVLLHANVTDIATHPDGRMVEGITVSTLDGVSRSVVAKTYVLSCGAIENARLLLAAELDGNGLGNRYDLVGRFYMEHLRGRTAILVTPERAPVIEDIFNLFMSADGTEHQVGIALGEEAQRDRQLLNCCAILDYEGDPTSGLTAGQSIWRGLQRGKWTDDLGAKVWRVVSDIDLVVSSVQRRLVEGRHPLMPLSSASIVVDMEQAPNPASRVMLGDGRDALGRPRAKIDWRFGALERRTARHFSEIAAAEFARLGHGRCRLADWLATDAEGWEPNLSETYHQMGTTRMSADPRDGVVDRDCRVHGIDNLYIAGSSVFPTGGHANPTLTIVALALRLADRLRAAT